MKCTKCNNEIPEGSKFCNHCGAKTTEEAYILCKCGTANPLDSFYCIECGCKLKVTGSPSLSPLFSYQEFDCIGEFRNGITWTYKDGKIAYIDKCGNRFTDFIYDSFDYNKMCKSIHEKVIISYLDGKYGLIDFNGKTVCTHEYDSIIDITKGYARVVKKGKWGCINTEGKVIIPCEYDWIGEFSEGLALFQIDGKRGYINTNRHIVIPPIYDYADSFSEGLAGVRKDGKSGYIDKNGNCVIPFLYDGTSIFIDGISVVWVNHKFGCIDRKGDYILPIEYDSINHHLKNNIIAKKSDFYSNGGYALFSKKGGMLTNYKYHNVEYLRNGIYHVSYYNKCGFIDVFGREITPCKYDCIYDYNGHEDVQYVSDGMIRVQRNKKYGFINTYGEEVIQCEYDYAGVFSCGVAPVYVRKHDNSSNIACIIDKKGNQIIPFVYDFIGEFSEGYAIVRKSWQYGFIDVYGNIVIPTIYDDAKPFQNGTAVVQQGEKWIIIHKKNTWQK